MKHKFIQSVLAVVLAMTLSLVLISCSCEEYVLLRARVVYEDNNEPVMSGMATLGYDKDEAWSPNITVINGSFQSDSIGPLEENCCFSVIVKNNKTGHVYADTSGFELCDEENELTILARRPSDEDGDGPPSPREDSLLFKKQ